MHTLAPLPSSSREQESAAMRFRTIGMLQSNNNRRYARKEETKARNRAWPR